MSKLEKIIEHLLFSEVKTLSEDERKQVAQAASRIMINEVMPLLQAEGTKPEEIETYHYGFTELLADLANLSAAGLIEPRHYKQVVKECWTNFIGYDLIQYAVESKIFEEVSGDELTSVITAVLQDPNNAKVIDQIKSGKGKAIGALVGQVVKQIKTSPAEVKDKLEKAILG